MKRSMMLTLHNPPTSHGDCFRASMASILGVDTEHVPHFLEAGDALGWWNKMRDWCFERGIYPIQQDPALMVPAGYALAIGESTEGEPHCVVVDGTSEVHDPRPSGMGLNAVDRFVSFLLTDADRFVAWRKTCE